MGENEGFVPRRTDLQDRLWHLSHGLADEEITKNLLCTTENGIELERRAAQIAVQHQFRVLGDREADFLDIRSPCMFSGIPRR